MKYTTLYFDLDNTLLDFSAAEAGAIAELLRLYGITPKPEYIKIYSLTNKKYWERFERGEIKREDIFEGRFIEFAELIGVSVDTKKMSHDYFSLLASGHDTVSGAEDVLKFAKNKGYIICVTTNGVSKTQHKRIKDSGLQKYFDYVFISEDTGHQKPQKAYFDYVLKNTPEKDRRKILIIGDSMSSDILGGIKSVIDTCWLNANGDKEKYKATYEIGNIRELIGIL